jgi:hypothetical protein
VVLAAWLTAGAATAEDDAQAVVRLRGEIDAMVAGHRQCHNVVHCRVVPIEGVTSACV